MIFSKHNISYEFDCSNCFKQHIITTNNRYKYELFRNIRFGVITKIKKFGLVQIIWVDNFTFVINFFVLVKT